MGTTTRRATPFRAPAGAGTEAMVLVTAADRCTVYYAPVRAVGGEVGRPVRR